MKKIRKQDSMLGIKSRKQFAFTCFGLGVLALIALFIGILMPAAGIGLAATIVPFTIIEGGSPKDEKSMNQGEKDLLATIQKAMNDKLTEFVEKGGTPEMLQKGLEGVLAEFTGNDMQEKSAEFSKRLKEISGWGEQIKKMAQKLEKMETKGIDFNQENEAPITKAIKEVLESEKFKHYSAGGSSKSGAIPVKTKAMSLGSNYSGGTAAITMVSGNVAENPQPRKLGMRDIMMVETSEEPNITYQEITSLDRNAAVVSENGELPESSFEVKEVSSSVRRIGTILFISKRMLRSVKWLTSYLSNRVPNKIRLAEDFQILKGDGTGENLLGIMVQCPDASTVFGTSNVTGAATSITAVASYSAGTKTLVTFANTQPFINNGSTITFSGFANAAYNATFKVNKVTDREIMIDVAYTSQTSAQCLAASFVCGGEFKDSVEAATEYDALLSCQAYLTYADYTPNGVCLNPIDVFKLRVLKDTTERPLDLIKQIGGVWYIGNLPIKETTAVVPDEFCMGDFSMGASLVDFETLTVEFSEDVTTKRKNQVAVIAQEEVILPVYNKYAFLKGKLSEVVTVINK